ncbi:unnamed protein product, partial [Iphiclides podalirius]
MDLNNFRSDSSSDDTDDDLETPHYDADSKDTPEFIREPTRQHILCRKRPMEGNSDDEQECSNLDTTSDQENVSTDSDLISKVKLDISLF